MPKVARELSALEVKRLRHPGKGGNACFAVGGISGLMLQVTPNNGRTWLLRVIVGSKRREIGLGGFPDVSLAQARDRAREIKEQIYRGVDPVEERKAMRAALVAAQRRGLTFSDAVEKSLEAGWKPSATPSIATSGAAPCEPMQNPNSGSCWCRISACRMSCAY